MANATPRGEPCYQVTVSLNAHDNTEHTSSFINLFKNGQMTEESYIYSSTGGDGYNWSYEVIYPGFSLVELLHYCALIGRDVTIVMLSQLSYAIKNQLKAPKAPYIGEFLAFRWFFMA